MASLGPPHTVAVEGYKLGYSNPVEVLNQVHLVDYILRLAIR